VPVPQSAPADPVLEAQKLLDQLGFNIGEPDGTLGTKTKNAIRLFQLQSGLEVTGEVTPELLDAMRAKSS
jgi:peptidoglycan hydrolase-like protein with peptidoglycan-binding domain